jgi:hypothetical protein
VLGERIGRDHYDLEILRFQVRLALEQGRLANLWEDAGCTDAELLAHLRGPGPHVRGCHGIDALQGLG